MKNFTFESPTKIIFGKNRIHDLAAEILAYGNRVLMVYGGQSIQQNGLYTQITEHLKENDISVFELAGVQPNPRLESVRAGIELCKTYEVDFILAVGGGSVIDCSKAIAAGVTYSGDVWDFFIRKAKIENALPIGSVLTLAATGSEMNGGTVISNPETSEKRPAGSDLLKPKFSILDPTLTFTVNKYLTSAGVVDVMSHIFEQYFTPDQGTTLQDHIAEAILKTCIQYGPVLMDDPENYEARSNIMWASSLALNGLTVTGKMYGDWATHYIEHELSAYYDLTHGAGLAILFPVWMNYVLDEKRAFKFAAYARNVWGVTIENDMEAALEGIAKTKAFFKEIGMPASLGEANIDDSKFDSMVEGACKFGPIGMFRKLNKEDVKNILTSAL